MADPYDDPLVRQRFLEAHPEVLEHSKQVWGAFTRALVYELNRHQIAFGRLLEMSTNLNQPLRATGQRGNQAFELIASYVDSDLEYPINEDHVDPAILTLEDCVLEVKKIVDFRRKVGGKIHQLVTAPQFYTLSDLKERIVGVFLRYLAKHRVGDVSDDAITLLSTQLTAIFTAEGISWRD